MKKLLDYLPKAENLLVVDLNSIAIDFYFQTGTSNLEDLDFSKLEKISSRQNQGIENNLLSSVDALSLFLEEELKMINGSGRHDFKLILLHSHETSDSEKEALEGLATKLNFFAYQLVERQFFYYQFLMQQKNFSKEKLVMNILQDKIELFLFKDQKLLFSRVIEDFYLFEEELQQLKFLTKKVQDFLFDFSLRKNKLKLEYLYLFDRGVLKKGFLDELSRELKLETIRTKNLC